MRVKRWIQKAKPRKGLLHEWMGVPQSEHIPKMKLREVARKEVGQTWHGKTVTAHRKRQVQFAINVQKRRG